MATQALITPSRQLTQTSSSSRQSNNKCLITVQSFHLSLLLLRGISCKTFVIWYSVISPSQSRQMSTQAHPGSTGLISVTGRFSPSLLIYKIDKILQAELSPATCLEAPPSSSPPPAAPQGLSQLHDLGLCHVLIPQVSCLKQRIFISFCVFNFWLQPSIAVRTENS